MLYLGHLKSSARIMVKSVVLGSLTIFIMRSIILGYFQPANNTNEYCVICAKAVLDMMIDYLLPVSNESDYFQLFSIFKKSYRVNGFVSYRKGE